MCALRRLRRRTIVIGQKAYQSASTEVLKSIKGGLAGLFVGACTSIAVLAMTRPDVETAALGRKLEALTLAEAQRLDPKARYDKISVSFAKSATVGIANENAIVVSGVVGHTKCTKKCLPSEADRIIGLVGPGKKTWLDAAVGRPAQLETKALVLFPEIGDGQAQFNDLQTVDLNRWFGRDLPQAGLHERSRGRLRTAYIRATRLQMECRLRATLHGSGGSSVQTRTRKRKDKAEEGCDIILGRGVDPDARGFQGHFHVGADRNRLLRPEQRFLASRRSGQQDEVSRDEGVLLRRLHDVRAHRAFFQPFRYEDGRWEPDRYLHGGKGIVYVNPMPLGDISPKEFFNDMVASLKVAGMVDLGVRLATATSCKTLK
jgi:hypothetical protein